MSSAHSLFGKPAWDKTMVSPIDLVSSPPPSSVPSSSASVTVVRRSDGPPGKLLSPHRAPRKSGLFARADEFAGLERLDRAELDDDDRAAS
jgi:hypothetical protein